MTSGCGRSPARPEAVDHVVILATQSFIACSEARQTTERTSVPSPAQYHLQRAFNGMECVSSMGKVQRL